MKIDEILIWQARNAHLSCDDTKNQLSRPLLCPKKLSVRFVRCWPVTVSHIYNFRGAIPVKWKSLVTDKSLYIPFTLNSDRQTIYLQPALVLLCEGEGPAGHQHIRDYYCPSKLDCRICTSWHLSKSRWQLLMSCSRLLPATLRPILSSLSSSTLFCTNKNISTLRFPVGI